MPRRPAGRELHECECAECRAHPQGETAEEHRAVNRVAAALDERNRRRFVGLLAFQSGRGGVTLYRQVTGLSRTTILRGQRELSRGKTPSDHRVRAPGGGRPRVEKSSRASSRR